ncbi:MAG: ABC transporter permease [Dongiaceae bacterium]
MLNFIVRRILTSIPVLAVVIVFVFLLLHLSPGDPAAMLAGPYAKAADIEKIREQLGFNAPLIEQFFNWVMQILRGDLGTSIFSQKPVTLLIGQRVEPTLALATVTMLITIPVAVSIGVLAAWKAGSWIDRGVMAFAVVGFSVPVFIFAYLLIYGFSLGLDLFPVQGYKSISEGFGPFIYHLVLPSITLSVIFIALIARITRASMLEILNEDYIRTAYAKGLHERKILLHHALKNAGVPIVTVIGFGIVLLIGGVVVTESVFNIPGLGRLVVDAVMKRDYPVIQGVILLFAAVNVFINLVIDIIYTAIDPRIRY